jgi:hypothetical protein
MPRCLDTAFACDLKPRVGLQNIMRYRFGLHIGVTFCFGGNVLSHFEVVQLLHHIIGL